MIAQTENGAMAPDKADPIAANGKRPTQAPVTGLVVGLAAGQSPRPQAISARPVSLLPLVVGMVLVGALFAWNTSYVWSAVVDWIAVIVLLCATFALSGYAVTGQWQAALIDGRNRMSLSRLQLVVWTVVVFSALLTAMLLNVIHGMAGPLDIGVPRELWLAMGISVTSLAGTPLILSTKTQQPASSQQLQQTKDLLALKGDSSVEAAGHLLVRDDPKMARWTDLFRGDEVGNGASLDLSKVQMFYLTLILVIGYAAAVGAMFYTFGLGVHDGQAAKISAFPAFDAGMVGLLGISHIGYLGYKAASHTPPSG